MKINSSFFRYCLALALVGALIMVMGACSSKSTTTTTTTSASTNTISPALSAINVYPSEPSKLWVGSTQVLEAWATYSDDSVEEITSQVTWVSENIVVATVDSSGLVKGVAVGAANIKVIFSEITSPTLTIKVVAAPSSITITPVEEGSLLAGTKKQYQATGIYADGATEDITDKVNWSSDNTNVATIDSTGVAEGVTSGTTNIMATLPGVNSYPRVTLTVIAPKLLSITVTPIPSKLWVGFTLQFKATGAYNNGSTADITPQVTWISSDTNVATIFSTGLATSVSVGTTNISANLSGVTSGNINLTVITQPH
jgi:uncharacterized protein YjdB